MTDKEAKKILLEMQKWRRGEAPYDGETPEEHRDMPYSPEVYGQAIDVAISALDKRIQCYGTE